MSGGASMSDCARAQSHAERRPLAAEAAAGGGARRAARAPMPGSVSMISLIGGIPARCGTCGRRQPVAKCGSGGLAALTETLSCV